MYNVYRNTRSRKPKLCDPLQFRTKKRYFVSPSELRNYFLNDTLVDWLNRYCPRPKEQFKDDSFTSFLMEQGNRFEERIVNHYRQQYPVKTVSTFINEKSVSETISLMKQGCPIIHSAPLYNKAHRTRGIADLLVRSDYINKLTRCPVLDEKSQYIRAPLLNGNYHYLVIEIKFTTLPLRSDGKFILNNDKFPFYKAQTWIYTQAVSKIQGYLSPYAFILGRRWSCRIKNANYRSFFPTNKLGVVDFKNVDSWCIQKTRDAMKWIREVKQFGGEWTCDPPSRDELYPNMKSPNQYYEKKRLADKNDEITMIWQCGVKQREKCLSQGVNRWSHPDFLSSLPNTKYSSVISRIVEVNNQDRVVIMPSKIQSDLYDWRRDEKKEIFVDFETILDVFSTCPIFQKRTFQIFMIGVWYKSDNVNESESESNWEYTNFVCDRLGVENEKVIMDQFSHFVVSRNIERVWFWNTESGIWNKRKGRNMNVMWSDLHKLFQSEPITIKGCFGFGLKEVSQVMFEHKLINSMIDSERSTGLQASVKAWETYHRHPNPAESGIMKDISRYNQFDVKVLHDMLTYLRSNH